MLNPGHARLHRHDRPRGRPPRPCQRPFRDHRRPRRELAGKPDGSPGGSIRRHPAGRVPGGGVRRAARGAGRLGRAGHFRAGQARNGCSRRAARDRDARRGRQ